MAFMRIGFIILGVLMTVTGLLWIGQGTGVFPYPASSFMISQWPWAIRGIILTIAGVLLVWLARRFLKPR